MRKATIILSILLLFGLVAWSLPVFADEAADNPDQTIVTTDSVIGTYKLKGSIRFYDWSSNWVCTLKDACLEVLDDGQGTDHKIISRIWVTKNTCGIPSHHFVPEDIGPPLVPAHMERSFIEGAGYVGPIERDASYNYVTNTPRISQTDLLGEYCQYNSSNPDMIFINLVLNGRVYYRTDPATLDPVVLRIKGDIKGWGEFGMQRDDLTHPSQGQFEGSFTATPLTKKDTDKGICVLP